MSSKFENIIIDGSSLTLEEAAAVARGTESDGNQDTGGTGSRPERSYPLVSLSGKAANRLKKVRDYVDNKWLSGNPPTIYGFNTGVGVLKDEQIETTENDRFQQLMIESHSAGIGEPAPEEVVRATMLFRANALARGVSGVRLEVVERLLEMLNKGLHPVIPSQGSVGASGDLAPMAHLVAALTGHQEAEINYRGQVMSAAEALEKADMEPAFKMKAKDVLAMVNGCTFTLGYAALALVDARDLLAGANLATALSMEAMRGERAAFDDRIQTARNQEGQREVAAEIRRLLKGSEWTTEEGRRIKLPYEKREGEFKPRVQDAYALRCVPQVHGATKDVFKFVREIVEREMNAATDNPLIFTKEDGGYEALSGGNFHGQYLAYAMDYLAVAVHELGDISERRSSRMMDPGLSYGLPPNLVGGQVGLNTGFTLAQCAASALVSENKGLCFPASADSIPTKSNQEDHVSMAPIAARKTRTIIKNTEKIIGIELLCAAQGISLTQDKMGELQLAEATAETMKKIRARVSETGNDRFIHKQMEVVCGMVRDKEFAEVVD